MKIGDVYYEKHTVVNLSPRTGDVLETNIEIVQAVPIEVLQEIRQEIESDVLETLADDGSDWFTAEKINDCLEIIDKHIKEYTK